jgi:hypothetical protein
LLLAAAVVEDLLFVLVEVVLVGCYLDTLVFPILPVLMQLLWVEVEVAETHQLYRECLTREDLAILLLHLVSLLPEAAVADQVLLQVVLLQLLEVLVEEHLQRHQEQQEQETLQQLYQDKDILGDLAQQLQTLVEQEVGVLEVQVILPLRRQLGVLEDLEELIPISHPLLLGGQYQQQFFQLGNH